MMQQRESLLDWVRASRCRSRSRKTSGLRRVRLPEFLTALPLVALFLGVLASSLLRPNDLAAQQQAWEYSPYKVQIWLATETAGELDERVRESLSFALARRIDASIGAPW
ncbi:MAG: hypothetical protein HYV60_03130, partial [Planctomycetia bacterium]|nr:hypothetical protein [Planctomycetia bacterium]